MAMRRRLVKDRSRRLLSIFLKRCREAKAVKEAEVLYAAHLEQMMRSRRWDDVEDYLQRFLLLIPWHERSPVSTNLFIDIMYIKILAKIAAGGKEASKAASLFRNLPPSTLADILKSFIAQMKSDETRPNMLKIWHKIELERVDIIMDMVAKCSELQGDHVTVPPDMPRTWVAAQHRLRKGPSRCKKKVAARTPSHVLACAFLGKRLLSTKGRRKAEMATMYREQTGRMWG